MHMYVCVHIYLYRDTYVSVTENVELKSAPDINKSMTQFRVIALAVT